MAQDVQVDANHELIIPVVILIPEDAVLTEDGAKWTLSARVVLDGAVDPRDEIAFGVVAPLA